MSSQTANCFTRAARSLSLYSPLSPMNMSQNTNAADFTSDIVKTQIVKRMKKRFVCILICCRLLLLTTAAGEQVCNKRPLLSPIMYMIQTPRSSSIQTIEQKRRITDDGSAAPRRGSQRRGGDETDRKTLYSFARGRMPNLASGEGSVRPARSIRKPAYRCVADTVDMPDGISPHII